jgi:hypothetical protein
LVVPASLDFPDAVDIHYVRAVHPQKWFASEVTLEFMEGGSDQQVFLSTMDPDIVVLGGDPIDLVGGKP